MIYKITTFCLKNYYWNFCWMTKSDPPWAIICIGISSHSQPQYPRCRRICLPRKCLGSPPRLNIETKYLPEPTCGSPELRPIAVDNRVQSSSLVVEHLNAASRLRILWGRTLEQNTTKKCDKYFSFDRTGSTAHMWGHIWWRGATLSDLTASSNPFLSIARPW